MAGIFREIEFYYKFAQPTLLHKKIVGIKAKSKSKIRIKPNLESSLNRVA